MALDMRNIPKICFLFPLTNLWHTWKDKEKQKIFRYVNDFPKGADY